MSGRLQPEDTVTPHAVRYTVARCDQCPSVHIIFTDDNGTTVLNLTFDPTDAIDLANQLISTARTH